MTNEKLMKIVQAVNDSKGEPVDLEDGFYPNIAISRGRDVFLKGEVHAVTSKATNRNWQLICTVEEFNQCVKEMSAGYGKKESDMKGNKHPHTHLITQWLMDRSARFQSGIGNDTSWSDCGISNLIADVEGEIMFRIKPREFIKGHWYPCVDEDSGVQVLMFTGKGLTATSMALHEESPDFYDDIGESLGEINFNEV